VAGQNQTVLFQNNVWNNNAICPYIYIYDDRFISENVFIGQYISIDQRRNLRLPALWWKRQKGVRMGV
jgi:hypothetical protein